MKRNSRLKSVIITLLLLLFTTVSISADQLDKTVMPLLNKYYRDFRDKEFFSGVALSIYLPNKPIQNYYIGTVNRSKNSAPIDKDSLFEIGSITKSFTAVKILQLVAEGKLKLTDTVGDYLPQYKKWGDITIEQLLNMSSGLPNYTDSPTMNYLFSKSPDTFWSKSDLINLVYPKNKLNPPLKPGYYYTNTGYILAGMIIEAVTHKSFKETLLNDIIKPMKLSDTFYPVPQLGSQIKNRLVQGYGYNQYDNPELVGQGIRDNNLSWAGAAGAVVANPEQIIKWVRHLFIKNELLSNKQKQQLMRIVSLQTGKPIKITTLDDPRGFGLGVIQAYDKNIGHFWYYQGETLGFRALYMYIPCNHIILALTVNSATNSENNHAGPFLNKIYQALLKKFPQYECQ